MRYGAGQKPSATLSPLEIANSASAAATIITESQNSSFIKVPNFQGAQFQGDCFASLAMTVTSVSFRDGRGPDPESMNTGLRNMDSGLRDAAPRMTMEAANVRVGALVGAGGVVQPVAQLLAGLEERHVLFGDFDAVAGPRVAADPGVAALDRKRAKAAQFDAVAARQGGGDLIEDRRDDDLDIALIEVREIGRAHV